VFGNRNSSGTPATPQIGKSRLWSRTVLAVRVLFGIGLVLGAWAFWFEPRSLVIRQQSIDLPHWSGPVAGLRVAFMADLHIGSPHWDLERFAALVEETNAQHPDIVLLAGDYLINGVKFGKWVDQESIARVLGGLKAPLGTVAVLGNHDWWNDGERVRAAFEANGIVVLENEAVSFEHEGGRFAIAGLADQMTREVRLKATIAQVPLGQPFLVLTHEPDIFPDVDERASLTLAGHTHGGQVNLPLLGRLVVPSAYGQRYASGHVVEGGRHLFVTNGVGTSIIPVRFGVPPEVVILELN
jgi:uncharacterized protein